MEAADVVTQIVPKSSDEEKTISSIVEANPTVPTDQFIGLLVQLVSEKVNENSAAGNPVDGAFLLHHTIEQRREIEALTDYTMMLPLINFSEKKPLPSLFSIQPFSETVAANGQKTDNKCFRGYILQPSKDVPMTDGLLGLRDIFENKIRGKSIIEGQIELGHILKCIHEGAAKGFCYFDHVNPVLKYRWVFHLHDKILYIYLVIPSTPNEAVEKPILSRWISATKPVFMQSINSLFRVQLSDEDFEAIANDPEVQSIKVT